MSVVLPMHNGERWAGEAIRSVLAQTVDNLELVIVDDASTDSSLEVASSFTDPRISILELKENVGLAAALNRGIHQTRAGIIARHDQDDISAPDRLEKQLSLLGVQADVVLVGTWATVIRPTLHGDWEVAGHHRHPTTDAELRLRLLWNNPFVHSSAVFRRDAFEAAGGYGTDPVNNWPEDYDLWSRMMHHGHLANVPEELVIYRETAGGMSHAYRDRIAEGVVRIASRNLGQATGRSPDDPTVRAVARSLNSQPTSRVGAAESLQRLSLFSKAVQQTCPRSGIGLVGARLRWSGKLLVRSLAPVRGSLVP